MLIKIFYVVKNAFNCCKKPTLLQLLFFKLKNLIPQAKELLGRFHSVVLSGMFSEAVTTLSTEHEIHKIMTSHRAVLRLQGRLHNILQDPKTQRYGFGVQKN